MRKIEEVAKTIEMLAKEKKEPISEMLKKLNLDKSTVYRMKSGCWPRGEKLKAIAEYYGVTDDYLLKDDDANSFDLLKKSGSEVYALDTDFIKIPIYGEIKAGYGRIAFEELLGYEAVGKSEIKGSSNEYFFLRVRGDSMSPTILDGDLVLIKKQSGIDYNGQISAVIVEDEATLKKVYVDSEKIMLVPINQLYEPVAYMKNKIKSIIIAGVVKELKRRL